MKITALDVEGFGVWTGLRLEGLADGLNVFFGPNEAGKTTLMQFVRSVLYGYTPERRRYFPPLHGGRHGGSLELAGPQGEFRVSRFDRSHQGGLSEELTVAGAEGFGHGPDLLQAILCNVDEAIYSNVFAVGLQELQELATLNDTEAAALLYSLSAGLDRVSLVEVMRELHASRNRLWDSGGGPCQVLQLLAERDKLQAEIEQLAALGARYGRLAGERDQLQRETAQLEEESRQLSHQIRLLEIAQVVRPRLQQRRALDEQLAALSAVEDFSPADAERLDRLNAGLEQRQKLWDELQGQWNQLRAEAERSTVHAAVLRQGPRIEALAEQEDWIRSLESRVSELQAEIGQIEAAWNAQRDRLKLPEGKLPSFSPRSLGALRPVALELRRYRQRLIESRAAVTAGQQAQQSLSERIQTSLDSRGERQLSEATDRLGALVAQLRRRLQLDERVDQMEEHQRELQEQIRDLLGQRMLPGSILLGVGALFVGGVVLVLLKAWEFFAPSSLFGALGWPMAVLGLAATVGAIVVKFLYERANARQMEDCRRQLHMLRAQTAQTKQERDALDRQLPRGTGTVESRLRAAERELAALEELVPLDAEREAARRQSEDAATHVQQAQADLAAARRRWQEALAAAGFPRGLSPKQVRELAVRAGEMNELGARLERLREELDQRSKELQGLTGRIAQLVGELQLGVSAASPVEQVHALLARLREEEDRLKRRRALGRQARELRRKRLRAKMGIVRVQRRRRMLLDAAGARDEVEFRRRAADHARAGQFRSEREAVQREIEAAIAGYCPEEEIHRQLEPGQGGGAQERREQLQRRLESCTAQLKQRYEKRGQLAEQLKALADNRAPAAKRLELGTVQQRLDEALQRWQVLAVTHQILERVRRSYEQTRQPETLQEASGYLGQMTLGRYGRVWTPLDEDVLVVDDAEGRPVAVELLSRGVREQLFLALRLALAANYARRGAQLPLILDDVLVNFDSQRARSAAALLRDFATAGHQLLVFTCHEHIAGLFQALRVEVRQLPDHAQPGAAAPVARKPASRQPRRRPPPPPPEEVVVHEVVVREEQVAVEEAPATPAPSVAPQPAPVPMEELPPWQEDDGEPVEGEGWAALEPGPDDMPSRQQRDDADSRGEPLGEGEALAADPGGTEAA